MNIGDIFWTTDQSIEGHDRTDSEPREPRQVKVITFREDLVEAAGFNPETGIPDYDSNSRVLTTEGRLHRTELEAWKAHAALMAAHRDELNWLASVASDKVWLANKKARDLAGKGVAS